MQNISQTIQAIGTFLIGLSLLIGVAVGSATIQNNGQGRIIYVTGKATRSIAPNQSVVSGTWEEKGRTSDEARNKARDKAGQGLEALKSKGIDSKKISTTQVSVFPDYDYSIVGDKPKIVGYRATTTLEVKLDDVQKADDVIGTLTSSGVTSTSGPTLGLTTQAKDQLEKDLRLEAVTDAKNQGEALAKQAGGRLGKVVSITQGGLSEPSKGIPAAYNDMAVSSKDSAGPSDIAVGEKEMTATVSVTYRLR